MGLQLEGVCVRRQSHGREEKGQGWLTEQQCPVWLHDLSILGQGKESAAQAWERVSVTLGEASGASPYFVSQKKPGKTCAPGTW